MLDVGGLLKPVSDEQPSGEALDYDIGFLQLEIAARGRSEQQMGDAVSAGAEPDWPLVESLALELSQRSKDIRVAILLTRALLHNAGFGGLEEGLRLLAGYAGQFWETLHPDPEPDEDDTIRMNALAALSDPAGLLGELRRVPLVRSQAAGTVSLRDIQIASREITPGPDAPPIAQADIEACFQAAAPGEIAATAAALASCAASIDAIAASVAQHDDTHVGVEFDSIRNALNEARTEVGSRLEQVDDEPGATQEVSEAAPGAAIRGGPGEIRGRSDIIAQIELICRWYAVNEPASPVPLLLDRAKRLVSQSFVALLTELAPAGLDQFRSIAGIRADAA
jgi:type VI secretion system protein ImpA